MDPCGDDAAFRETMRMLIAHGRDREAAALGSNRMIAAPTGDVMDPIRQLDEVIPALIDVVSGIGPDQLGSPTPCADYDIGGVLTHMIGGARAFAAAFRGGEPPADGMPSDLLQAFPAEMRDLRAAAGEAGVLDRTVHSPVGSLPGDTVARFVALDGLVHGWDLSVATGRPYDPPLEVVTAATGFAATAITDDMRAAGAFGPERLPGPGATPLEKLAAFTGRSTG